MYVNEKKSTRDIRSGTMRSRGEHKGKKITLFGKDPKTSYD